MNMKDLYVKASVIYIGSDRYGLDWRITFRRLSQIIEDPDMDDLVTSEYSNIGSYEERSRSFMLHFDGYMRRAYTAHILSQLNSEITTLYWSEYGPPPDQND